MIFASRKHTAYDPQKNEPASNPPKPMRITAYCKIYLQIRETWVEMFGEREYEDFMMKAMIDTMIDRDFPEFNEFDSIPRDTIQASIRRLVSVDDWAYELAYGRERSWPIESRQIGMAGAGRKIRKSRRNPYRIEWIG